MNEANRKPFRGLLSALLLTVALASCALVIGGEAPPLRPVEAVDLERYAGEWHVIANIPYFLERGNVAARTRYRLREDGRLDDVYLYREAFGDPLRRMEGVARLVEGSGGARWEVQFVWPMWFDYVIIALDDDYRTAAIAHPSRDYGWILAREPRIDEADYERLLEAFSAQGYDPERFLKVPQFPGQQGRPGFQ
ncbi:MAG: lipocalin family protein [Wenzhouxiangellaceae bacterium]|nr:lipocalin family protein [Wenzhouxiangellaceae bacterium]